MEFSGGTCLLSDFDHTWRLVAVFFRAGARGGERESGFPLLLLICVGGFFGRHIGFGGLSNTLIPWFGYGVFLRAGWATDS